MLGKIALVTLLLIAMASAETIQSENYTFNFSIDRSHVIQDKTIKTYDGHISFCDIGGNPINFDRESLIGITTISNYMTFIYQGGLNYYDITAPDRFMITSTMNLTDTIDFLKSLKIEKLKA